MRKSLSITILSLAAVTCGGFLTLAQESPPAPERDPALATNPPGGVAVVVTMPPPATKLEALGRRDNAVILRGYTDVSGLRDDDGTMVRVLAVEMSESVMKEKALGLAIEVHQHQPIQRTTVSLVDENEIDGLIAGIEALAKIDHADSPLANYDARYRTRGALELANIDVAGTRRITLTATQILPANGQLVWGTASFPLSRAKELQNQIKLAKETLSRINPQPAQ